MLVSLCSQQEQLYQAIKGLYYKTRSKKAMHICLIMDNPETPQHPVIAVALQKLAHNHSVRLLDVRGLTDEQAIAREQAQTLADLYLLKSPAPQALALAHVLEQHGAGQCRGGGGLHEHYVCGRSWPARRGPSRTSS